MQREIPKKVVVSVEMESQLTELADPDADMPMYVLATGSALIDLDGGDSEIALDSVKLSVLTPHGDFDRELLDSSAIPPRRKILTRLDVAPLSY